MNTADVLECSEDFRRLNFQPSNYLNNQGKNSPRPAAWIARGLEACRRAGVSEDYFIARYLRRESLPLDRRVDDAMRELAAEARRAIAGPPVLCNNYGTAERSVVPARDSLKASIT